MTKAIPLVLIILMVLATSILPIQANQIPQPRQTGDIILTLLNDGYGDPTDGIVEVPAYTPGFGQTPTLALNFSIQAYGNAIYYGDDAGEDWKNITITGDILDPPNGANIHHLTCGD
jgi:hypothetical protein